MSLTLGNTTFESTDLLIMAIVNRTPDSFYDSGATFSDDAAMAAVDRAIDEGADIIDIGGVKAGPGEFVDAEEEIRRTVNFVEAVRAKHDAIIISVDTWRHEVGDKVCEAGADILNEGLPVGEDIPAGLEADLLGGSARAQLAAGLVDENTEV